MLTRFIKVSKNLLRGSAPSVEDLLILHKKYGVDRVISLDQASADQIKLACQLLGIEQIILPVDFRKPITIFRLLKQDFKDLFDSHYQIYLHCRWGKDRTGLVVALYRCLIQHWSCQEAYQEAKQIGMAVGFDLEIQQLLRDIIIDTCPKCNSLEGLNTEERDVNSADDIVEGAHIAGTYDDYYGSPSENLSWAPFLDYRGREYPYANVELRNPEEQYETREDYGLDDRDPGTHSPVQMPQTGIYNDASPGINGMGPSALSDWFV